MISMRCVTLASISASKKFHQKTLVRGEGTFLKDKIKIRKKPFNLQKILLNKLVLGFQGRTKII
jgi:hypothetical protein